MHLLQPLAIAIVLQALPAAAQTIPVVFPSATEVSRPFSSPFHAEPYPGQFRLPEPPLSEPQAAFAPSFEASVDRSEPDVVAALDVLTPEQWQRRILWRPVELNNTGFQVMMPNQPRYVSEGRSDQPMQTQHFLSSSDPGNDALYMVGWRDAVSLADAETQAILFETERNAIVNGFAGELLHETNVQLQGSAGKHYKILGRLDGEPWIITHRAYALGDRLVQMTVAVPQEREPEFMGRAEGFLRSLQPL